MSKIYLAGPMSGIPKFNYPMFDKAAEELRHLGIDVVSPAEMDDPETRRAALASPDGRMGSASPNGETWGDFLARDLKLIADGGVEGVALLTGWYRSKGARQEVFTAINLNLPVYYVTETLMRRKLEAVPTEELFVDLEHGIELAYLK